MVIDQNDRMFPYSGLGATRGPVSQPPGPVRLPQMEPTKGLLPKRTVKSRRKGYEQRKPSGLAIPPDYPMTLGPSFLLGHGGSQVGRGSSFSSPRVRTAPALGMPDDEQFFYGGRLVPPDAYDFAEGGEVYYGGDEGLSDEEKRQREAAAIANAGDVPVPAPAPQPPAPTGPIFGPTEPTYQENVQAVAQQMTPAQLQGAANELAQSGYYDTVVPVIRDIQSAIAGRNEAGAYPVPSSAGPPMVQSPAGREDIRAPEGSLRAQAIGQQQTQQSTVATVPEGYRESPLVTGARVAQGPLQVAGGLYNIANVDIPLVSPAARAVAPYIAEGINAGGAANQLINRGLDLAGVPEPVRMPSPFSAANFLLKQAGAPSVGNIASDFTIGSGGAVDLGLMFAPKIGDIPINMLARRASGIGAASGAVRTALTARGSQQAFQPQQVYRLAVREGALAPVPAANELAASLGSMRIANPDLARVLQPGEALRPGEQLMFHGGNLSGPIRPDTFVTPSERTAESIARFNERAATLPRPGIREALAERATRGLGLTPSPDVAPAGVRSIASEIQMPGVRGGASQQEPLASILRRADAGDPKVTAAYLRSVADDRGIDLAGATKKNDVLAALRGAETPTPPARPSGGLTWSNADYDAPINVTGYLGEQNGRHFFSIEGSTTGVPLDEIKGSADEIARLRGLTGGGTPGSLPGPEAVAGPVAATPPPASTAPTRELWDDFVSENVPNPGALPVNDLDKYN